MIVTHAITVTAGSSSKSAMHSRRRVLTGARRTLTTPVMKLWTSRKVPPERSGGLKLHAPRGSSVRVA